MSAINKLFKLRIKYFINTINAKPLKFRGGWGLSGNSLKLPIDIWLIELSNVTSLPFYLKMWDRGVLIEIFFINLYCHKICVRILTCKWPFWLFISWFFYGQFILTALFGQFFVQNCCLVVFCRLYLSFDQLIFYTRVTSFLFLCVFTCICKQFEYVR